MRAIRNEQNRSQQWIGSISPVTGAISARKPNPFINIGSNGLFFPNKQHPNDLWPYEIEAFLNLSRREYVNGINSPCTRAGQYLIRALEFNSEMPNH